MNDLDWKQPALIGGLIAGTLAVVPVVNLVNCCFCAWALIGGAVASKMLINRTPRPIKSGEGAQVGLMAGLIAAGIYLLLSVPIAMLGVGEGFQQSLLEQLRERSSDPQVQEMIQKMIEASANQTPAQRLAASIPIFLIFALIYGGFTILGGLLGVALFEKRKDQPPPYPPYPPGNPPNYPPNHPPNYPPQSGGYGGGQGGQGGWPQS